jgi:hypothetical protein
MATKRPLFMGVDPGQMYDPQQAYSTISGYGIPLDANMERAKTLAGWSGVGPVSGEGINRVIQTAAGEMNADFLPWGADPSMFDTPAGMPGMLPSSPTAPPMAPPSPMSPGGIFPAISAGQFTTLDPQAVYDPQQTIQYLSAMIGQDFNPYLEEAIPIALGAGWGGSGTPLLGAYVNPIIAEIQKRMTMGGGGGTAPPPPTGGPFGGPTVPPPSYGTPGVGTVPPRPGNTGVLPPTGPGPLQGENVPTGTDDLSQDITAQIRNMLQYEGSTAFGDEIGRRLLGIIQSGGTYPGEVREVGGDLARALDLAYADLDPNTDLEFEAAREMNEKGRRASRRSLSASLADRGLLSEPGIPQGVESQAIRSSEERLGAEFAGALRDISIDRARRRGERVGQLISGAGQLAGLKQQDRTALDQRMLSALQLATGMSGDQARNTIAAIQQGTGRQDVLAQIALQSLEQNQAWNKFLAEYGLKRDEVMYNIRQGNLAQYVPLLNAFLQMVSLSRGGYI